MKEVEGEELVGGVSNTIGVAASISIKISVSDTSGGGSTLDDKTQPHNVIWVINI